MSFDFSGPASLQSSVDFSMSAMRETLQNYTSSWGVVVTPADGLSNAINSAVDGEVITLLPGRYRLASQLDINKKVIVQGFGRVIIEGPTTSVLLLSADESEIRGVVLERKEPETGGTLAETLLTVSGDRCRVSNCTVNCHTNYGIYVTGSSDVVQGCRFEDSSRHSGSGDMDIYWADGATNGQAYGNMHSTTREYVISHRSADNLSEAANGRSAIINAR